MAWGPFNAGGASLPAFRSRGKPDDLNDAMSQGWYAYTDGTTNAPDSGSGIVQVLSVGGYIWPIQAAYVNGNAIFIRTYNGSSWSAWTNINSWRGVQNSLTSDSTTESLSAAMGKALKELVDGKAASSHTHSKSDVGLGNVDNTADANKSVSYANSAGSAGSAGVAAQLGRDGNVSTPMIFKWEGQEGQPSFLFGSNDGSTFQAYSPSSFHVNYADTSTIATKLASAGNTGTPMTFSWNGQTGQPAWLWGCNERENSYVYNPATFHVAYADSAGTASGFSGLPYTITFEGCYAGTGTGGSAAAPIVFTLSKQYDAVGVIACGSYGDKACVARNLLELLTHENSSVSFPSNFIPTGMLNSDWTVLKDIPEGCCVIAGVWANGSTSAQKYMRLNGTNLELYVTSYADNAAHAINSSGKVYYYYGLNFIPFHF